MNTKWIPTKGQLFYVQKHDKVTQYLPGMMGETIIVTREKDNTWNNFIFKMVAQDDTLMLGLVVYDQFNVMLNKQWALQKSDCNFCQLDQTSPKH